MIFSSNRDAHLAPSIPAWEDHLAIVDALYRFGAGQDCADRALFESSFVADASLDFVQPAARFGVAMPVLRGRAVIVDAIMQAVAGVDTTHTVTNPRVWVDGNEARLWTLVEAQHVPKDDPSRELLLKNIYEVTLSRAEGCWKMRDVVIRNIWFRGEAAVLFPEEAAAG